MKALIIGTGFLGEQIHEEIKNYCKEVFVTHNKNKKYSFSKKFDLFQDDISEIFNLNEVNTVFFSAMVEFQENKKLLNKSMGNFLDKIKNKRLVYISSDGIFDGKKGQYKEDDEVNPITLYGENLETCENLIKRKVKNFCIIRPSYLYGFVNGKLDGRFSKLKSELEKGERVERFIDMYKSPLSYKQAAEVVVKVGLSNFKGIVNVSGDKKSVYKLSKEGMQALKVSTENLIGIKMPQKRPKNFLPDTSLDFSLMIKLTKVKPLSIKKSMRLK